MFNLILYLLIPAIILCLWFFAKDLKLPERMVETGLSRELLKVSLFIYNKISGFKFLKKEKIRTYLGSLNYRKDMEEAETEYFIRKISTMLLLILAGSILSFLICLSNTTKGKLADDNTVSRKEYGDGNYTISLDATDENGNYMGAFEVEVNERVYTDDEVKELFDSACVVMEETVLNGNSSFDKVTTSLNLPEKLPGYPFHISWHIDNYQVLHFDGKLIEENIPKEGVVVTLLATYKYNDKSFAQTIVANLYRKELTKEEQIKKEIEALLGKTQEDTTYDKNFELPDEYQGQKIIWSERFEDNSILFLILMLIAGAASFVLKDKELRNKIEDRKKQMLSDYPQLLSQLVLFLGAGMTMRNIFERLSATYLKKKKDSLQKRYLYEEVVRANRELLSGMSEAKVYESFGIRCGGQQYARLSTLLSQNLRKGNGELFNLLQEESQKAFEERLDKTRKIGEEAGTKLLLPMIMMLVIVMVIIMIPAYLAF